MPDKIINNVVIDGQPGKFYAPNVLTGLEETEAVNELKSGFNDLYNTAYVTDSSSGAIAHFEDGADNVPMKSVVIDTESASATVTRTGENVIPINAKTATASGVTLIINDDGSILINGTAEENNGILLNKFSQVKNFPSGKYAVAVFGDNTTGLALQIRSNTGFLSPNNGVITIPEDSINNYVRLRFASGTTFNNVIVYPMMVRGDAVPTEYEPYNGNTYEVTLVDGVVQEEIKSLLGVNNVWSDAGDVEVEYRADTKLYIKRLTDSDTDMIADSNITSGQYFMVGNDLYKATVNIASGAQIVVGTNATKVSLSEALNEINA